MKTPYLLSAQRLILDYRVVPILLVQLILVTGSYVTSFVLRLDLDLGEVPWGLVAKTLPLLVGIRLVMLALFRMHRGLWRYVSVVDLLQIVKATTLGSALFIVLLVPIFGLSGYPRSVFFLDWAGNIFLPKWSAVVYKGLA